MIADITDGETYYLWHDEELENLNAPDEAFINFHYHLKDIEYNQNNIHLKFISLLSRRLLDDNFRKQLIEVEDVEDAYRALNAINEQL